MSVVLKRGGKPMFGAGQEVTQEKKMLEVIVDGKLMKGDAGWYLTGVEFDLQQMKKIGFENEDVVKITVRSPRVLK